MANNDDFQTPRWVYRFDNFKRAFALLSEAIQIIRKRKISALEQEGVIQRFEYTWELSWKVLKDYLEYTGIILETVTPAAVIKAAIAANIIKNGDVWMSALDSRNRMSHTYDFKQFEKIVISIEKEYYPELECMRLKMLELSTEVKNNCV